MLSVPIKLMIAVILHPILRYLRPSEAEIEICGGREWAWPAHAFSPAEKFSLLVVFDFTCPYDLITKFIDVCKNLQVISHN